MKPVMLMILDGFGLSNDINSSAILKANTPKLDEIFKNYPKTSLGASGLDVGLPDGQMGNSEVGHLNIGAGRIVYQELTRITKSINDGDFFENEILVAAMQHAINNNSALHIMGLLSDGGVHSHISHLFALIDMAKKYGINNLYIHCFLDGRDVPPRCALKYIEELQKHIANVSLGKIGIISGRYYAMDRDKRFERIELAYDALTLGNGIKADSPISAIEQAYKRDENDEFVLPTVIDDGSGFMPIKDNDSVIMFNFRPDRARQITRTFVAPASDFDGFNRKVVLNNLCYVCMTQYDATMPNVMVAYPPQTLANTFGAYIADKGLRQLRIAETEKYAHVTFFFNGGVEAPERNEDRILIPSPKVATYDLKPEMSAYEVKDRVIEEINKDIYDVIVLNFANADMVGHTGIMDAAISAIEALENCVPPIIDAILEKDGQILLTADHGNADCMLDSKGNVVTAHSLNPVPLLYIANQKRNLADGGILADIAPTLLDMLNLSKPKEMEGISLLK